MHTKIGAVAIIGLLLMFSAHLGLAAESGPEGEPELVFDNNGTIDRITNDDIVIDDSGFKLATQATFYNKDGTPAFRSKFKVGVKVEYHVNSLKEVDALRLTR
jgi:hypothetical protein